MYNVLLVKGGSQYNALRNYMDEMEVGCRLAGYNTHLIDATEQSWMFQCEELIHSISIDLLFTCKAALPAQVPGAYYLTYLTDHLAFHRKRPEALNERACVLA